MGDFWIALEEYEEYVTAEGQSRDSPPPLQIVASAGSVVHVGDSVGSSFGTVASAESAVLTQSSSRDFGALATEIKTLRETVPADPPDRDNQIYVGALAEAEAAAEAHDVSTVILRFAGSAYGRRIGGQSFHPQEASPRRPAPYARQEVAQCGST